MTVALPPEASLLSHRIVSVPRLDDGDDRSSAAARSRSRMLPTAAMAHAAGGAIACAWVRVAGRGRTALLVGGIPAEPGAGEVPLAFPAGARGRALPAGSAHGALDRFGAWAQAELALDGAPRGDGAPPAPPLEELFALLSERAMGILAVARPRPRVEVQVTLDELSDRTAQLETQRAGRGFARLELARAEGELEYFERVGPQGLWELEVWTAGATVEEAHAVAALLGASADLSELPLAIRPPTAGTPAGDGLRWSATRIVGADCVVALVRPPSRELPGIRVADVPTFDVTPEVSGPLRLGAVWDSTRSPSLPFSVPVDSVNRHVFVTGATGSGKSQTVRALLEALTAAAVPWMVVEPAKSEYAGMAGRTAPTPLCVIRPGQRDQVPASLNPLEPSSIRVGDEVHRFPLQTHVDLVRALFTASFQAEDPFPQILATALSQSYESQGWDLALSAPVDGAGDRAPRYPTLADVQREALVAVDAIGYGREVRDNVQGFVRVRIDSLRQGTPGRFFEGGHPLDVEALLDRNVVFEIEDLGDARDQAFFIGTVLIRVFEVLRLREAHGRLGSGLGHVTVIEEAHRLLHRADEGSSTGQAVTMFANLLAEVRAYGEGIVVAEQIPAKVIPDVVKNSAVKLMHRLPSADDRAFVGATMNLSEHQAETVVALPPGVAAAHVDGMDAPVLVHIDARGAGREGRDRHRRPLPPVAVRSPSCPSACAAQPCTFEQLVVAQRTTTPGWLGLWAEVVTVAHLFGEAPRSVGPEVLAELEALAPERARCALGLLVDAAVDRRHAVVRRYYDPALLRRQVVSTMRRQWSEGLDAPAQGPAWTVASFRWADVAQALVADPQGADVTRPHRSTADWARRGLDLPGPTWADQRAQAKAIRRRHAPGDRGAFLGSPPVLGPLASRLGQGDTVEQQLQSALVRAGLPHRWPVVRLGRLLSETGP